MKKTPRYAGFFIRAVASFFDTLFLALPLGVLIYIVSGGEWFDLSTYYHNMQLAAVGNPQALNNQPQTSLKWELLFEVSVLLVTLLFWKQWGGTTPGKRLVGIKIVDATTLNEMSTKQAITRNLGYIPSALLFGLGFFMVLFHKKKQALHDILANTVVIYEERE